MKPKTDQICASPPGFVSHTLYQAPGRDIGCEPIISVNSISLYSFHPPLFLPLYMSCSESVLELSIMPKDEDVLQLVSVSMVFFTHLIPPTQQTNPHISGIHTHCRKRNILRCLFAEFNADLPRHCRRMWRFLLEWLQSDSEALCSVFRLQHAFIKSRRCPDRRSSR